MTSQAPPVHSFDAIEPRRRVRLREAAFLKKRSAAIEVRQRQPEKLGHNTGGHIASLGYAARSHARQSPNAFAYQGTN